MAEPRSFFDGRAVLYRANCLELLPSLGKFDHVFADPPYEEHTHARGGREVRYDGGPEFAALPFAPVTAIRAEAARVICGAASGWALIFSTPEGVAPWRDAIEATGARYKRACVWVKPDSAPQFNGQGPAAGAENIVTAWCGSGYSRWNGGGRRGVFQHSVNGPNRQGEHPTEKPLALMAVLVTLFTVPGETIADPFMGSGTTALACIKHGRRFVGIEQDPKWFELACRRLEAAERQPDFFIEVEPLKQASMFAVQAAGAPVQPSEKFSVSDGVKHVEHEPREQPEARVTPVSGDLNGEAAHVLEDSGSGGAGDASGDRLDRGDDTQAGDGEAPEPLGHAAPVSAEAPRINEHTHLPMMPEMPAHLRRLSAGAAHG